MKLIISILIPVLLGAAVAFFTRGGMEAYSVDVIKPPLTPPPVVFGIVWTILYALMGVSYWLIENSAATIPEKRSARNVYIAQLAVNLIWPLIFFGMMEYFSAFLWLIMLWIWVFIMILEFRKISGTAAFLQIPYLIWLTFAAYLNFGVYYLN